MKKLREKYSNGDYLACMLTVFDVLMKILVLPKAYSLAEIGRSLRRQVTPSTLPPPCQ